MIGYCRMWSNTKRRVFEELENEIQVHEGDHPSFIVNNKQVVQVISSLVGSEIINWNEQNFIESGNRSDFSRSINDIPISKELSVKIATCLMKYIARVSTLRFKILFPEDAFAGRLLPDIPFLPNLA